MQTSPYKPFRTSESHGLGATGTLNELKGNGDSALSLWCVKIVIPIESTWVLAA